MPLAKAKTARSRPRKQRSRLDPQARERMILEEATAFFAENGFGAQTKDLANRLGISHGLIFRYFGTKESLIERVYQNVFLQRWSELWEAGLRNRKKPLAQRLEEFYLAYFKAVNDNQWIRVSLYAGLSGSDIIARYIQAYVDRVLRIIVEEIRHYQNRADKGTIDPLEYELVWHLHSTFIYLLIRKYVHHLPIMEDTERLVSGVVGNFVRGLVRKGD